MAASRDLDKAKEAYKEKDVEKMIETHSTKAPERHQIEAGKYVKSLIYGGVDGIITTFAIVAGVVGANLEFSAILILGFANLLADGLSMGIGDYLSSKSEREYEQGEREREEWEVEHYPEGEKKEMIEIYEDKGMSSEDAKIIVDTLSKYPKAWVDTMMSEELGIIETDDSPAKNGVATFLSFALFGLVPLITYVVAQLVPYLRDNPSLSFLLACILTGITLFVLGALKVKVTGKNFIRSGLEMLALGGIAAAAAYGIGFGLRALIG